jgi:hypothetical protein
MAAGNPIFAAVLDKPKKPPISFSRTIRLGAAVCVYVACVVTAHAVGALFNRLLGGSERV